MEADKQKLIALAERDVEYRLTHVVTTDYGDGPGAGITTIGHFAAMPNGSHWQDRPAMLVLRVPRGTRPGAKITLRALATKETNDAD